MMVPSLKIVKSNLLLRPYCVVATCCCALGTEKVMRLASLAVPSTATTAIPVAALSCGSGIPLLGSSWLGHLELCDPSAVPVPDSYT